MSTLRDLLDTWENWSARDTLTRALVKVTTEDTRERITKSLADKPSTSALDGLRDSTELVELLAGWQWQAMHAAHRDGASWEQIAVAAHNTTEAARAGFAAVLDRQGSVLGRDVSADHEVL